MTQIVLKVHVVSLVHVDSFYFCI